MATTTTYSGNLDLTLALRGAYSADSTGGRVLKRTEAIVFAAAGGTAPTLSGFLNGTGTFAGAVTLLLAHATDPFQGAGDAVYSDGFTVAGARLKVLCIEHTGASGTLTIARAAANGLPLFDAASDAVTLDPGGILLIYLKTGTATLTTGSNDGLTITPSAGTITADISVAYGP